MRILILALLLLCSCSQSKVTKLLRSEVLELYRKGTLDYEEAILIDSLGRPLDESIDFSKEVVYEFFSNGSENITEVMQLPFTSFEDEIYAIQLRLIPTFNPENYKVPFDCDTAQQSLRQAGITDQAVRNGELDLDINDLDDKNQRLIVSSIEKCGFPKMSDIGKLAVHSVWIIMHHSNKSMIAYYFQDLEKALYTGALSTVDLAYTIDRLLMYEGYPQVYGTQFRRGEFYTLRKPAEINIRRIAVGLPPFDQWELENYVGLKQMIN